MKESVQVQTAISGERNAEVRQDRTADQVANFDRIARAYRWMEYLSLGSLLEQTRTRHLGRLGDARRVLVLGDGDGRFTARLLEANAQVQVTAVDASSAMLRLLEQRCNTYRDRLTLRRADARTYVPEANVDLVVTHFFLDCLTQDESRVLMDRLRPTLAPGALWLVSEFRIPEGWLKWPATAFVRSLYLAFRVLTGLRVKRLPDHAAALRDCGFRLVEQQRLLAGVLTAELWRHSA